MKLPKVTHVWLRKTDKRRKKPQLIFQYEHPVLRDGKTITHEYRTLDCDDATAATMLSQIKNDLILHRFNMSTYFPDLLKQQITVADWLAKYTNHRERQVKTKEISPRTLKKDLEVFAKFLTVMHPATPIVQITRQHLLEYRQHLQQLKTRYGTPFSNTTINMHLRHLSSAFGWAIEQGIITENPLSRLKKLKETTSRGRELSQNEIEQLRAAAVLSPHQLNPAKYPRAHTPPPPWWFSALNALLWLGLRTEGIINANVNDIFQLNIENKTRHFISITEKGRKTRKLPIPDKLWQLWQPRIAILNNPDAVNEILDRTVTGKTPKSRKIFLDRAKAGYIYFEVSRTDSVTHMIGKLVTRAGLNATAHDCRHTFASRIAQKSVPLKVKELLGHADIKTSEIYTHANLTFLAEDIDTLTDF